MQSLVVFALALCVFAARIALPVQLNFIGDVNLPTATNFQGIPLGGLSALSYDASQDILYALSDDRGKRGGVRYYEFKIHLSKSAFSLAPTKIRFLKRADGSAFAVGRLDPEGFSFLPDGSLLVSSEGNNAPNPRIPPEILRFSAAGNLLGRLMVPAKFIPESSGVQSRGVFDNKGFEALALSPSGRHLFMGTEYPIMTDFTSWPTLRQAQAIRIVKMTASASGWAASGEFAYPVGGAFREHDARRGKVGLVELLALDDVRLFALERGGEPDFGTATYVNYVRLFELELTGATDVSDFDSLKGKRYQPVKKRLLLDFDEILPSLDANWRRLDNLEGMTLGPQLANGNRTLILVSDNNFSANQRTLFLAFELIP